MREDRIDEAALALLYLEHWIEGPDNIARAWKSLGWNALERLHAKGLISNPIGKSKSITLSDKGVSLAKQAHDALFQGKEPSRTAGLLQSSRWRPARQSGSPSPEVDIPLARQLSGSAVSCQARIAAALGQLPHQPLPEARGAPSACQRSRPRSLRRWPD